ncbi:MAG: hypothetical protein ACT4QG_20800 [Sporichthyaceae bacterium]
MVGAAAGIAIGTSGRGEDLPGTRPQIRYGLYDKKPGDTDFSMGVRLGAEPGKTVQILEAKALFSANVEYLGAYAVWPRNFASSGLAEGYPYADQKVRHPLNEPIPAAETTVFDPESQHYLPIVVTLGFRILSGKGGVNGIHVTYKESGKTKREYFPYGAIGCVKPLRCEGDDQRTDSATFRELGLMRGD